MMRPLGKTILISGQSGLIGTSLIRSFSSDRIQPIRLVRRTAETPDEVCWNPDAVEPVKDLSRLEDAQAAIHLSGSGLSARRWTEAYKREIAESRVRTTQALVKMLKGLKNPPQSLLCASATGIYGDRGDEILTERSAIGRGFLADTCRAWEAEADRAAEAGIRVVHLRFGVVLASEGGALQQMLPLFRLGLGGRLGSGRQWMSWIALSDLVRAVSHILQADSLAGAVHLVAPIPVTNAGFTRALGAAVHRPAILPAPAFALRAAFGEMADAALLASTRAVPERLAGSGFHFNFPEITGALQSIL
ncbi:MAG: TIGR01777 family oxidoreductase [Silvibacterium sp.]